VTIRFEQAWEDCFKVLCSPAADVLHEAGKVVVVRDLLGRIHLALQHAPPLERLAPLVQKLEKAVGSFWSQRVLDGQTMVAPESVFESPDAYEKESGLWVLERLVTGADWGRGPLKTSSSRQPPRATLYGLKGGVGRSTALAAWAWHLAKLGHRVLVIDLDLESPGVSSLLLPTELQPPYGIVDWFVEDAVGNADTELLRLMVAPSPLSDDTSGQILVAPCGSPLDGDYLSKLSRAYVDVPSERGPRSFGERLAEMLDQLTEHYHPDVVLLDSRAGLHDVAAIATTRLGAMTFLFAAGTRQTWDGYRILLRSWAKHPPVAREIRERLRVVAAQIPETERVAHLERFRQCAYDIFADTLYEEAGPEQPEAFNFDVYATDAPHDPLRINWARVLQDWEPTSKTVSYEELRAFMGDFLDRATELVLQVNPLLEEQEIV
jgi:hypothetical protein